MHSACPSCQSCQHSEVYQIENVPAHSVLLFDTQKEAIQFPRGDIHLALCEECGFVWNRSFDSSLHQYSQRYEETQGFSGTFNAFHKKLAVHLIERFNLRGKTILEIGCGKGEFLSLLCELEDNRGIGIDPAYRPDRNESHALERMTFLREFYGPQHASLQPDFICCKMTLEHIHETRKFLTTLRSSLSENEECVIFFQVPNASYVFKDLAFWDIYYEHCSYFTEESLRNLFYLSGFAVTDTWTDYDDQYLMIEAVPAKNNQPLIPPKETLKTVTNFKGIIPSTIEHWKNTMNSFVKNRKKVALWGAGSKGVAFCSTLGLENQISLAIDINPYKNQTYLAGVGYRIGLPEELQESPADVILLMNPIYVDEVQSWLNEHQVKGEVVPIHSL